MRKLLWMVPLLLLLPAFAAPNARADSLYTYSYTETYQPSDFGFSFTTVAIPEITSDTVLPDSDLSSFIFSLGLGELARGPIYGVEMDSGGLGDTVILYAPSEPFAAFNDGFAPADYETPGTYVGPFGTMAVTEVTSTPEPSSGVLMVLGIALVFVMWKCAGDRLPQAS